MAIAAYVKAIERDLQSGPVAMVLARIPPK
jgi:hypothetical protein